MLPILFSLLLILQSPGAVQENSSSDTPARWSSFRNGGDSFESASELPLTWGAEKGIAWDVELTGYGQSAPIVWNNRVFVCSVVGPDKETLALSCLSLDDGQVRWSQEVVASNQGPSNYMNSRAAPTPVVDAMGVYAFFESGDLVAIDHDGKRLWTKNLSESLGPFQNNHGLGTSPAQNSELIFLNLEHQGPSKLVAVRKIDGAVQWSVERPASTSWTSPIVCTMNQKEQVIVSSGGTITAYDTSGGQRLWQFDDVLGNSVPSPTPHQNMLLIGARLPEFGSPADVAKSNLCLEFLPNQDTPTLKWRSQRAMAEYASPVVVDGCVYLIDKLGMLHCLDLASGEALYSERLGMEVWSTPIAQTGKLYIFGKNGRTKVVKTGFNFVELASNDLWDLAAPPSPQSYVEKVQTRTEETSSDGKPQASRTFRRLMRSDANGNGILEADEIPAPMKDAVQQYDVDQDNALDAQEVEAMSGDFEAKRADSQPSSRDPIVYGVAASQSRILLRTGTHLYCIRDREAKQ